MSTVTLSAPLVLAALGGLTSERSGVMNIGLEGTMLSAACAACFVGLQTQNMWLGLLAAVVVGVVLMQVHGILTQAFGIDQIISGMAINALAAGATSFVNKGFLTLGVTARPVLLPKQFFWIAALAAVFLIGVIMNRTRAGLRLSAVGNDPDKSRQMGVDPIAIRYLALAATGLLCGFSGALIASNAGSFTDNMTAGRGYIALAALIIGGWRPWPTLIACLGFGLIEALQLHLQGTQLAGASVPTEFWTSLPYLVTLIALAGLLGKNRAPAGLGRP
ncbi:MAG: ABC transporter permease [Armatimonadetes bacterium]|nr:ABC transporter permease [Armatimonadota bacterium]